MIYTLTTNPSIDMNIQTSEPIEYSAINRTFGSVYTANGKGLNVSYVLKHYGVDSKILGFFGGFTGDYVVSDFRDKGFDVIPVYVKDTTRVNVFLNDSKGEFNLVNEGSYVPKSSQKEMLDKIRGFSDLDILSISGSLPRGISEDYYDDVLSLCREKNAKIILDISSKKLKDLLKYNPYLIKPNDKEVQEIFGFKVDDESDIITCLEKLHTMGAQNILLTMGEAGMYFYDGINVYYAVAKPVKVLSSACAGDSSLAAFLSVYLNNKDEVEEALKLSCATGANVVESSGIGSLEKVEEYKLGTHVRRVQT